MIGQRNRVDVPLEWLQALQIEPVEPERKKREVESRRCAFERGAKPACSQPCTNGFRLPLQEQERPHRSKPPDVHRVEITADELRGVDTIERADHRLQ